MRSAQDRKQKGSFRWKQRFLTRTQRFLTRTQRFLTQQKKRTRDSEHQVGRAVVEWAKERKAGTIAMGDVRDGAAGTRLGAKSQQKLGLWSHGNLRRYITYKAQAEGMSVEPVEA